MTHPLNNRRLQSILEEFRGVHIRKNLIETIEIFDADDMRWAADWQLEQDQKELEDFLEEFLCRGHGYEANSDLRAFVNNFKSDMRPKQQENS